MLLMIIGAFEGSMTEPPVALFSSEFMPKVKVTFHFSDTLAKNVQNFCQKSAIKRKSKFLSQFWALVYGIDCDLTHP